MQACEKRCTGRSTHGASGIMSGKHYSVLSKRVDIRCVYHPFAVTQEIRSVPPAQVKISEVVSKDKHDIRPVLRNRHAGSSAAAGTAG